MDKSGNINLCVRRKDGEGEEEGQKGPRVSSLLFSILVSVEKNGKIKRRIEDEESSVAQGRQAGRQAWVVLRG